MWREWRPRRPLRQIENVRLQARRGRAESTEERLEYLMDLVCELETEQETLTARVQQLESGHAQPSAPQADLTLNEN